MEKIEIAPPATDFIASFVDGSLRDAISILDQLTPYTGGKIRLKDVESLLGIPQQEIFFELTDAIIGRDSKAIITLVDSALTQGVAAKEILNGLINHLHTLFLIKTSADDVTMKSHDSRLDEQAKAFGTSSILRLITFLFDTEKRLRDALSEEIYLEQSLVRAALFTRVAIDEIINQLEQPEDTVDNVKLKGQETIPTEVYATQPIPTEPSSEHSLHQIWKTALKKLAKDKPWIESFATHSTPVEMSDGKLTLQCENEFFREKLKESSAMLDTTITEIVGTPVQVVFTAPTERKKGLIDEQIVKTAIDLFSAEPVSKQGL